MPLSDDERSLLDQSFAADKTEAAPDVRGILERASTVDPARHAQVLDIASRRQLPISTVDNNLDELKARDNLDANDPSTFGPELTKFFANADNAALAHDDIDNLKETENTFRFAPAGEQLQTLGSGIKNIAASLIAGQHRVTSSAYGLLGGGVDILRGMTTDQMINAGLIENDQVLKPVSDFFDKARKSSTEWADYIAPDATNVFEKGVYGGIESFSSNATSMALSVIAGNPAYALGLMTAQTGGNALGVAKDQGMQIDDRLVYAATDTAIEYYTEKNPVTKLIEDLTHNSGFVKTFVTQQISEGIGEQAATALQDLNAWAMLPENKDKPFSAYLAERPSAALETLISTFVATSVNTGVMHGISKLAEPAVKETDKTAGKVVDSMADQEKIDKLITLAQSSKLGGIATEKYKEFLKGAGSDNKIYVPMDIIRDVPNLPPSVTAQINDLGGDVEIPVEDFMSSMVNDEKIMAVIRPHLTMGLDKFSSSEIEKGAADQTIRSLLERANLKASEKVELDAHQESMFNQIMSTGRYTPQVAKTVAALDAAQMAGIARASGLTIQQVLERKNTELYGPGHYKKMADATEVMDQIDPEVKQWFDDSKVIDEKGLPLTVYHSTDADVSGEFQFSPDKIGEKSGHTGDYGRGFYFSEDQNYSKKFGKNTIAANVSLKNPLVIQQGLNTGDKDYQDFINEKRANGPDAAAKLLQDRGYDGVIVNKPKGTSTDKNIYEEVVAFDPSQIKVLKPTTTLNQEDITDIPDDIADELVIAYKEAGSNDDNFRIPRGANKEIGDTIKSVLPIGTTFESDDTVLEVAKEEAEKRGDPEVADVIRFDVPFQKQGKVEPEWGYAYVYMDVNKNVWLDVSTLVKGSGQGTYFYSKVRDWADANGGNFVGDPEGLSDDALLRRTEHMVSQIARNKSIASVKPHERQIDPAVKSGWQYKDSPLNKIIPPIPWTNNAKINERNLVKASYRNMLAVMPELKDATYDYKTGNILYKGTPIGVGSQSTTSRTSGRVRPETSGKGQGTDLLGSDAGGAPVIPSFEDFVQKIRSGVLQGLGTGQGVKNAEDRKVYGSASIKRFILANTAVRTPGEGARRQLLADDRWSRDLTNLDQEKIFYQSTPDTPVTKRRDVVKTLMNCLRG